MGYTDWNTVHDLMVRRTGSYYCRCLGWFFSGITLTPDEAKASHKLHLKNLVKKS